MLRNCRSWIDNLQCRKRRTFYEGWQGGHYETSILTTLFSLLFWDILFLSDTETRKAMFQHPFRSEFFLCVESYIHFQIDRSLVFYESHKDTCEQRLLEILMGNWYGFLLKNHERESKTETICVGVRWDIPFDHLNQFATVRALKHQYLIV